MTWDDYFAQMCTLVGAKSKDRSTKVGCVVVGPDHEVRSTGFNGFPRGVNDDREEWHARPMKYRATEHSERNAIYNAARCGIPLLGCTLYVPWHPCTDCARGIIQAGIVAVVLDPAFRLSEDVLHRWREDLDVASQLLREGGVAVRMGRAAAGDVQPSAECPGHERGGTGPPCCDRAGDYNGFGSDGPLLFTCPKGCGCHD